MISVITEFLGPWAWVVFGLLLLGLEIILPSSFLLWPSLAALVVGAITLVLGIDNPVWPWQLQVIVFLALSLIIAFFGRRIMANRGWDKSEMSDLNERGSQMVGQTAVLQDAIVNGRGRIKIGDTTWRVQGDDAKAGTKVTVIRPDGGTLFVEAG